MPASNLTSLAEEDPMKVVTVSTRRCDESFCTLRLLQLGGLLVAQLSAEVRTHLSLLLLLLSVFGSYCLCVCFCFLLIKRAK